MVIGDRPNVDEISCSPQRPAGTNAHQAELAHLAVQVRTRASAKRGDVDAVRLDPEYLMQSATAFTGE
jgi:hypothetical protein